MGTYYSYVHEHNIPPVGRDGIIYHCDNIESENIYYYFNLYRDVYGRAKNHCFLTRDDPVRSIHFEPFSDILKNIEDSSEYKVGCITDEKKILEKFEVLKKLYDNNLCDMYFTTYHSKTYTLKMLKFDSFKGAVNYRIPHIVDGYATLTYPTFVYRYLGEDPIQKIKEDIKLERFNAMLNREDVKE